MAAAPASPRSPLSARSPRSAAADSAVGSKASPKGARAERGERIRSRKTGLVPSSLVLDLEKQVAYLLHASPVLADVLGAAPGPPAPAWAALGDVASSEAKGKGGGTAPRRDPKPEVLDAALGEHLRERATSLIREEAVKRVCAAFNMASIDGPKGVQVKTFCRKVGKDMTGVLSYDELKITLRKTLKLTQQCISNDEVDLLCEALGENNKRTIPMRNLIAFTISRKEQERLNLTTELLQLQEKLDTTRSALQSVARDVRETPRLGGGDDPSKRADLLDAHAKVGALEVKINTVKRGLLQRKPKASKKQLVLDEGVLKVLRGRLQLASYSAEGGITATELARKLEADAPKKSAAFVGKLKLEEFRRGMRYRIKIPQEILNDTQLESLFQCLDREETGLVKVSMLFAFSMEGKSALYAEEPADGRRDTNDFLRCLVDSFGSLEQAFKALAGVEDGILTYRKLLGGLAEHGVPWREATQCKDLLSVFRELDNNNDGHINLTELLVHECAVEPDPEASPSRLRRAAAVATTAAPGGGSPRTKRWSLRPTPEWNEANAEAEERAQTLRRNDPDKFHRDNEAHRQRKLANLERLHAEKMNKDLQELTLTPAISPHTRQLLATKLSHYVPPGEPEHSEFHARPFKVLDHEIKDAAECTFKPVVNPQSSKMVRAHGYDSEPFHERLSQVRTIYDRMANKTAEHVQDRLDGNAHRPHITEHGHSFRVQEPFTTRLHCDANRLSAERRANRMMLMNQTEQSRGSKPKPTPESDAVPEDDCGAGASDYGRDTAQAWGSVTANPLAAAALQRSESPHGGGGDDAVSAGEMTAEA